MLQSAASVYANQTGKEKFAKFGRTLAPYCYGMNYKQLTEVFDVMQNGTKEEKEKLWIKISNVSLPINFDEYYSNDPKVLYSNLTAKTRIAQIIGNQGGSSSDFPHYILKDKATSAKNEAVYTTGCGFNFAVAMAQANVCELMNGVFLEDWFVEDTTMTSMLINQYDETGDKVKRNSVSVTVISRWVRKNSAFWKSLSAGYIS